MDKANLYRSVAELHIANINQGFISTLGIDFVTLMYRAIDECDDSVLLVARVNEQVVGFVTGSHGMGPIYRNMLRHWPRLLWALLPSLISPRRVMRIIEILRYSSGTSGSAEPPMAELLSIAVDPASRGQHHAEILYKQLCQHFTGCGVPSFKIVVGEALAPAHKFYRRMGAQPTTEVKVHKGSASTIYVQKLPRE
jgi:ribosomal protein S18 acetylase RimI-like enzyme